MPDRTAIISKYTDNVARNATITIETGTDPDDDDYAPASLVDDNPAKVAKIDSTTGAWLFDFLTAQRLDLVALIHHVFAVGVDVKIQGNATNVWTSPTFEAAFTIPMWLGSGRTLWPVNPWLDLTAQAGYSATGFRYWRLIITSNSQLIQLGEVVMLASITRLDPDFPWGFDRGAKRGIIENKTAFDVSTTYIRGTNVWSHSSVHNVTSALADYLDAHWEDVGGRALPWLLIPDGTINVAYLVKWLELERKRTYVQPGVQVYRANIQEVSRGLRPGL